MLNIAFPKYCVAHLLEQELEEAGLVRGVKFDGITSYQTSPEDPYEPKTIVHAMDDIMAEDFTLIETVVTAHVPPEGA